MKLLLVIALLFSEESLLCTNAATNFLNRIESTVREGEIFKCIACVIAPGGGASFSWVTGACRRGNVKSTCPQGTGSTARCCVDVECCVTDGCRSPEDTVEAPAANTRDETNAPALHCHTCCEELENGSTRVRSWNPPSTTSSYSGTSVEAGAIAVVDVIGGSSSPAGVPATAKTVTDFSPWYNTYTTEVFELRNCPPCALCTHRAESVIHRFLNSKNVPFKDGQPCTSEFCNDFRKNAAQAAASEAASAAVRSDGDDACISSSIIHTCECFCKMASELLEQCPHYAEQIYEKALAMGSSSSEVKFVSVAATGGEKKDAAIVEKNIVNPTSTVLPEKTEPSNEIEQQKGQPQEQIWAEAEQQQELGSSQELEVKKENTNFPPEESMEQENGEQQPEQSSSFPPAETGEDQSLEDKTGDDEGNEKDDDIACTVGHVESMNELRARNILYKDGPCTRNLCNGLRGVSYIVDPCISSENSCMCFCYMANPLVDVCPKYEPFLFSGSFSSSSAAEGDTAEEEGGSSSLDSPMVAVGAGTDLSSSAGQANTTTVKNVGDDNDSSCLAEHVEAMNALKSREVSYVDGPCTRHLCDGLRGVSYLADPCTVSTNSCMCFCNVANYLLDQCPKYGHALLFDDDSSSSVEVIEGLKGSDAVALGRSFEVGAQESYAIVPSTSAADDYVRFSWSIIVSVLHMGVMALILF